MDMNERSQSEMIRVQNIENANRAKQNNARNNLLAQQDRNIQRGLQASPKLNQIY